MTDTSSQNVYYEIMQATVNLSNALTYSEETMAQYGNLLASVLDGVYQEANSVLASDASAVVNAKTSTQPGNQEIYNTDSQYYQNLETLYNSMVDTANTTVNNLANGQSQLIQFASTMNGDQLFVSNLLAQPLG